MALFIFAWASRSAALASTNFGYKIDHTQSKRLAAATRTCVNQWRSLVIGRRTAEKRKRTDTVQSLDPADLLTGISPVVATPVWYPWGTTPFSYRRTATLPPPSNDVSLLRRQASLRRHMLVY